MDISYLEAGKPLTYHPEDKMEVSLLSTVQCGISMVKRHNILAKDVSRPRT